MANMYDPQLSRLIGAAIARLQNELTRTMPFSAQLALDWMQRLAGPARPRDYFQHPLAFPALLLPWWLEKKLRDAPDESLQADLVASTINGYYHIRLIDNLMDGNATVELNLLPALNFFHTQFQTPYQRHFEPGHPFWNFFETTWFHAADVTIQDARLTQIDEAQFQQVAAQKICAAKIPLAGVGYKYRRAEALEPWLQLVDLLGCWHQMHNDLFDWHRDLTRQTRTYFLEQARRHKNASEPVAGWVAREGFAWGISRLNGWMSALERLARQLASDDLLAYLRARQIMLQQQSADAAAGLKSLAKIIGVE